MARATTRNQKYTRETNSIEKNDLEDVEGADILVLAFLENRHALRCRHVPAFGSFVPSVGVVFRTCDSNILEVMMPRLRW